MGYARTTGRRDGLGAGGWDFLSDGDCRGPCSEQTNSKSAPSARKKSSWDTMLPTLEVKIETSATCVMAKNPRSPRLWIIAALLAGGIPAHAQSPPPPIDPAISSLAARIAEPLQKAHGTKVVVAELWGPEGQSHPIGKYLADQLTVALQK